jgi:hypothetical protein
MSGSGLALPHFMLFKQPNAPPHFMPLKRQSVSLQDLTPAGLTPAVGEGA